MIKTSTRIASLCLAFALFLTACLPFARQSPSTLVPTIIIPTPTKTSLPTLYPTATRTSVGTRVSAESTTKQTPVPGEESAASAFPAEGRGPGGFAADVNPLTGLSVKDADTLNRRPVVVKVENLPRNHRPQWGLTFADLVYEYYTEQGATRFAAIFYGSNAERVGPIRSGRFFDANVVQMYKGVFVYGSAYRDVQNSFFSSDFANRLILESGKSCPALCRYDPNGQNLLVTNTNELQTYLQQNKIDNTRQNLDGMFFMQAAPDGGEPAKQVFLRYSGAIYNRWDYDPATGRYLRFVDSQDDVNRNNEVYGQLTDKLADKPVSAENVVTLCVPHEYYTKTEETEVMNMLMDPGGPDYKGCDGKTYHGGTGAAYIARDGRQYPVMWQREKKDAVLTLVNPDGSLFPFKPGQTWFEVIGASSKVESPTAGVWRFTHHMVP